MSIPATFLLFLATLVYRYDFERDPIHNPAQVADFGTGWIEMNSLSGSDVPIRDAVYDLHVKSQERAAELGGFIPAIEFGLSDAIYNPQTLLTWGPDLWSIQGISFQSPAITQFDFDTGALDNPRAVARITDMYILNFWPGALFSTAGVIGSWKFAGAVEVPETGGTLALFALGLIAFWPIARNLQK